MAISRHDPEWIKTIGVAMLAGVMFEPVSARYSSPERRAGESSVWWYATLPDGYKVVGSSKYSAARRALVALGD